MILFPKSSILKLSIAILISFIFFLNFILASSSFCILSSRFKSNFILAPNSEIKSLNGFLLLPPLLDFLFLLVPEVFEVFIISPLMKELYSLEILLAVLATFPKILAILPPSLCSFISTITSIFTSLSFNLSISRFIFLIASSFAFAYSSKSPLASAEFILSLIVSNSLIKFLNPGCSSKILKLNKFLLFISFIVFSNISFLSLILSISFSISFTASASLSIFLTFLYA